MVNGHVIFKVEVQIPDPVTDPAYESAEPNQDQVLHVRQGPNKLTRRRAISYTERRTYRNAAYANKITRSGGASETRKGTTPT